MNNAIDYIVGGICAAILLWIAISCYQVSDPGPLAPWSIFKIWEAFR